MRVDQWLTRHQGELGSDFEYLFVENVLGKVESIDFANVTCQYSFRDADGRQRYCDFVLQEGPWVKIALEADGYDKRATGHGMSKADFVDWQRRHAALVSQGWYVLRFANTDIRDYPEKCRHHIELLLRDRRAQAQHLAYLRDEVERLKGQSDKRASQRIGADEAKQKLQKRIEELEKLLKDARHTKPLTIDESDELRRLTDAQERIATLKGENAIMKTTIWAFTIIIVVGLIAAVVAFGPYGRRAQDTSAGTSDYSSLTKHAKQVRTPGSTIDGSTLAAAVPDQAQSRDTWCSPTDGWYEATYFVGRQMTIEGPVKRISTPRNVKGNPTFIIIGVDDPIYEDLTLLVWGSDREKFEPVLRTGLIGSHVCVSGTVSQYQGNPEIVLRSADQLSARWVSTGNL